MEKEETQWPETDSHLENTDIPVSGNIIKFIKRLDIQHKILKKLIYPTSGDLKKDNNERENP